MYVAKADGVEDIMSAAKKDGKSFEEFIKELDRHSIPFPPPIAKLLWDDEKLSQLFERTGGKGWSQLDYAFENAGWAVDHFGARLSEGGVSGHYRHFVDGEMKEGLFSWNRPKWPTVYQFDNLKEAGWDPL